MSGFCGIISFHDNMFDEHRSDFELMKTAISHRGPDRHDEYISSSVALANHILHTTEESIKEQLPLVKNDQSLVLVSDARIDNQEELIQKLKI